MLHFLEGLKKRSKYVIAMMDYQSPGELGGYQSGCEGRGPGVGVGGGGHQSGCEGRGPGVGMRGGHLVSEY